MLIRNRLQYEATRRAMTELYPNESISGPKDYIPIDGDGTEGLNENETDETENGRSLRKKRKEGLPASH